MKNPIGSQFLIEWNATKHATNQRFSSDKHFQSKVIKRMYKGKIKLLIQCMSVYSKKKHEMGVDHI